jgi:cob(I)alamin adenosyltransferase
MRLYTGRGDDGLTDLFGGRRVGKDSLRVEAYGTVDELNSVVGWALVACPFEEIATVLRTQQNRLFDLGADLANPHPPNSAEKPSGAAGARIGPGAIAEAERSIDAASAAVPPLRVFILPGGTELAARLHVARAVCRRAERLCVALDKVEPVGRDALVFLNRLSDLLFALARRANQLGGR